MEMTLGEAADSYHKQKASIAKDIGEFLAAHAKMNVNEPNEYSSPDASALSGFASLIRNSSRIPEGSCPWSSWSSGGYQPNNDKGAEAWHDGILLDIKKLMDFQRELATLRSELADRQMT